MSVGTIIFVVTNYSLLGGLGSQTGWFLPEVAHPHHVLKNAGYEIVFVSPKGGEAPMDRGSGEYFKNDHICQTFLDNEHVILKDGVHMLKDTLTAADINPTEYKALFYAGGYGASVDIPYAADIAELATKIYEQDGVLSAVGYGPAGFLPLRVDGKPLVTGQKVTSFTIEEEEAADLTKYVHFELETRLRELGADFVGKQKWACNVQVSGRLITCQNTASAKRVGGEMIKLLSK